MPRNKFFGIGVYHPKFEVNIGTLFRSADVFKASFIYTVGRRYKRQGSDTTKAAGNIPLYHYDTIESLVSNLPHGCPLVGVELDDRSVMLNEFEHPERACYLLGAEDHGIPPAALDRCHHVVQIPWASICLNVSVAGSLVIYDRIAKNGIPLK